MNNTRTWRRRITAGAVALTVVLAAAACSSPEEAADGGGGASAGGGSIPDDVLSMEELYAGTYADPPATSPPGAAGSSVWWISCSQAVVSCSEPAAAAQEAAETLGIDFNIADGKFNAGGAFTTAVRTALAADPDAIMLYGVACELVRGPLEEARSQGVLVMGVETPDCSDSGGPQLFDVTEQYNELYPTTPDLWRGFGAFAADYIINESGGSARIISSAGTEPLQNFVNEGFAAEIEKCSGCEIVEEVPYDSAKLVPNGPWIQDLRSAIVANPDANAVYLPFDVMMTTLGGAQAVQEAGLDATIFGGQAAPDGLDFLREGRIDAQTTSRDTGWSAFAAMDTINRALQDAPSVPQGIGFQLVTPDENLPDSGAYVPPIDYRAAYLAAWNGGEGTE